jgi:hypothetical protein
MNRLIRAVNADISAGILTCWKRGSAMEVQNYWQTFPIHTDNAVVDLDSSFSRV